MDSCVRTLRNCLHKDVEHTLNDFICRPCAPNRPLNALEGVHKMKKPCPDETLKCDTIPISASHPSKGEAAELFFVLSIIPLQ
jgi:hypothetical protein